MATISGRSFVAETRIDDVIDDPAIVVQKARGKTLAPGREAAPPERCQMAA